jgi:hypothetical protein
VTKAVLANVSIVIARGLPPLAGAEQGRDGVGPALTPGPLFRRKKGGCGAAAPGRGPTCLSAAPADSARPAVAGVESSPKPLEHQKKGPVAIGGRHVNGKMRSLPSVSPVAVE